MLQESCCVAVQLMQPAADIMRALQQSYAAARCKSTTDTCSTQMHMMHNRLLVKHTAMHMPFGAEVLLQLSHWKGHCCRRKENRVACSELLYAAAACTSPHSLACDTHLRRPLQLLLQDFLRSTPTSS